MRTRIGGEGGEISRAEPCGEHPTARSVNGRGRVEEAYVGIPSWMPPSEEKDQFFIHGKACRKNSRKRKRGKELSQKVRNIGDATRSEPKSLCFEQLGVIENGIVQTGDEVHS